MDWTRWQQDATARDRAGNSSSIRHSGSSLCDCEHQHSQWLPI
ncbi:hypothetical protein KR093_004566 [Drosophila rubida]|uniref:Uncharacterized protein n=1 Tax=Drosophila rubida TaxID=30044 RepID=A0AAD4K9X0_9MUSC|nr:hypothetical protein KR093_004566 [Drosophila rubida]